MKLEGQRASKPAWKSFGIRGFAGSPYLLATMEESRLTFYMVCDKCGNNKWYLIVPNPYKHGQAYQIQVCSKCGFAVEVIYEVKNFKFLKPDELLSKLKKEE